MLRRLLLLVVFMLVVSACVNQSTTTTSGQSGTVEPAETTTTIPPGATTAPPPSTTSTPPDLSGLVGLSDELKAQLETLIAVAQEIRELPFLSPPNISVVSLDELEARVRELIEEDTEDIPADEALYKLLGVLPSETDLEVLLLDLYGEQVAGFYDGETGEIVVPAREGGLSILQEGTMVHELVHALTDQHFAFNPVFQTMIDDDRLDEATGYQALIEGDATLAEVLWVQNLSQQEIGRFIAESLEVDSSTLDAVPDFLRDSLLFPYDSGLAFVQNLYRSDGWGGVNGAYMTFPGLPGSSEQVITPDDFERDLPITVDIPTVTVDGYQLERTSVWGEQGFRTILDQVIGGSESARAADGWGGDSFHQWFDGENAAFLLVYEGDTARDVDEMQVALLDFAVTSVAEDDFVWVEVDGDRLYFIAADVVGVGESIRAAVGLG